jgi:hypothetical protein
LIRLVWIGLLASTLLASTAQADAASPSQHRISLGVGLPFPFEAYGGDASLEGTGLDLAFILHARASYSANPFGAMPRLVIGARGSFSTATVTDGELSLWGWLFMAGPHAGVRITPELWPSATLVIAGGPALARSGFRIDENLHEEFWSGAVFGFAQLSLPLTEALQLTLDAALEHVLPAPEDETFFNQRLGSTTLLTLAVGVELVL